MPFDLDNAALEIPCPRCGFYESVTIRQIRLGDVLICGGCKGNIALVDLEGEVWVARAELNAAISNLAEVLEKGLSFKIRL